MCPFVFELYLLCKFSAVIGLHSMVSEVLCSLTYDSSLASSYMPVPCFDLMWARFILYLAYRILLKVEPNLKICETSNKILGFLFLLKTRKIWQYQACISQITIWIPKQAALHDSQSAPVPGAHLPRGCPLPSSSHWHRFSGRRALFIFLLACNKTKKTQEQIESIMHLQENRR